MKTRCVCSIMHSLNRTLNDVGSRRCCVRWYVRWCIIAILLLCGAEIRSDKGVQEKENQKISDWLCSDWWVTVCNSSHTGTCKRVDVRKSIRFLITSPHWAALELIDGRMKDFAIDLELGSSMISFQIQFQTNRSYYFVCIEYLSFVEFWLKTFVQ